MAEPQAPETAAEPVPEFSAELEAENCARLLGDRRHGLEPVAED